MAGYLSKVRQSDEQGKEAAHKQDIGFFQAMLCSMLAGAMASTATNPLDMGKLRLQVQRAGASEFHYKHLADAVYQIGRQEGVLALFRGSMARCLFHIPMTAISMSVLEKSRPHLVTALERYL